MTTPPRPLVLLCTASLLLIALSVTAHPGGHSTADDVERLVQRLGTRQMEDPESGSVVEAVRAGYPLPPDPRERFSGFQTRTDITAAGDLEGALRVMRFAHATDLQLVDDDAPYPMRQGMLDAVYGPTISGGAERPQEEYGDEILWSLTDVLNAHHAIDRLDYAIHTGDNIDNALENELMRYLDILRGTHTTTGPISGFVCQPDGQSESIEDDAHDVTDACTSLPEHLVPFLRGVAPDLPWFSLYGNHDGLIQGNVNVEPGFQEAAAEFGRYFIRGNEYVAMHFAGNEACGGGSVDDDFGQGYGFAGARLCNDDPEDDAYYAFDHQGIRMIALDTVNHEVYQSHKEGELLPDSGTTGHNLASGLSEGAIDVTQFAWLQEELEASKDRLVFIYAHHTINSFYNRQFDALCGPPGCFNDIMSEAGFIGREEMQALLGQYPNVVAMIGGHSHEHRVTAQQPNGTSPGYWNIETSGLLDLPQESRIIEVWLTADGKKGFFALDPIGHLFQKAKDLAATDDQHDGAAAAGTTADQRVLMWFDVPVGAAPEFGPPPSGTAPDTLLTFTLEGPEAIDGIAVLESQGPVTLRISLWSEVTDESVTDMAVAFAVTGIDTTGGAHIAIDYAAFPPMMEVGDGIYETTWTFSEPGVHHGTFRVEDPSGFYPTLHKLVKFDVPERADKKDTGIPGAAAGVVVLALLAVAALARRRD